jgi:hypothetical protein
MRFSMRLQVGEVGLTMQPYIAKKEKMEGITNTQVILQDIERQAIITALSQPSNTCCNCKSNGELHSRIEALNNEMLVGLENVNSRLSIFDTRANEAEEAIKKKVDQITASLDAIMIYLKNHHL